MCDTHTNSTHIFVSHTVGRGRGAAKFIGNKRFRDLIKLHKAEYNSCDKHNSKVSIAFHVRNVIRERGGRFLELVNTNNGQPARSVIETGVWKIAREDVAIERCKQSLREKELTQEQKNKIRARNIAKRKRKMLGDDSSLEQGTDEAAAELRRLAEAEEQILQQQASRALPPMMPPTNNLHSMMLLGGPPPASRMTSAAVHHPRLLMFQQALLQQRQQHRAVLDGGHYHHLNPLYQPRSAIGSSAMRMREHYGPPPPFAQHSPGMSPQARFSYQEALRSSQERLSYQEALRSQERLSYQEALRFPRTVAQRMAQVSSVSPPRAAASVTDTEKDALSALFALSGEADKKQKANPKATKFAAL